MQPIFQEHNCLTQIELKAYLEGTLNNKDRFRVENHLLDCPLCSDAVEGFGLSHTQAPQKVKAFNPNPYRWLRTAAAVLLVAVSLLSLRYFFSSNENRLYEAYYEAYPNELKQDLRSGDSEGQKVQAPEYIVKAFEAYDNGDFAESARLFSEERTSDNYSAIAHFYGGIAALEAGDTPKAIQLLRAAGQKGLLYETEARWYLALALLKEGKMEEASSILNQFISDPDSRYHEEAKTLRSKF
ncbi:MAG: hypothetical protein GYB31_06240 [Bacteroidetes bacterium]|nr:hypothetical protein [Bacteroidota bacterium]